MGRSRWERWENEGVKLLGIEYGVGRDVLLSFQESGRP